MNTQIQIAIRKVNGQNKLAQLTNVNQSTVSRWLFGKMQVSATNALKIEAATKGAVSKSDLRPDLWPPEKSYDKKN